MKKDLIDELNRVLIDELSRYDLYDLFRIRDSLETLNAYGLADEELLAEVNRIIQEKV